QAELVVDLGRVDITIFRALPEFALIGAAGKHRPILLRLMAEDGELFPFHFCRTKRHHALDLVRLPFFPSAAVEPDFELLALSANLAHSLKYSLGTNPMGAVRIGQFACYVNLGRLKPAEERDNISDILGMDRGFSDSSGSIKTQVHELQLFGRHAARQCRRTRFRF